jgi:hypothetical protein
MFSAPDRTVSQAKSDSCHTNSIGAGTQLLSQESVRLHADLGTPSFAAMSISVPIQATGVKEIK